MLNPSKRLPRQPLDKYLDNPFNQPDPQANPKPTKEELLIKNLVPRK